MKYVGGSVRKDPRVEIRRRGDPQFGHLDERTSAGVAFSDGLIGSLVAGLDALLIFCGGLAILLAYLGWGWYDKNSSSYLLALVINTIITVAAFNSAGLYRCEYLTRPVYQIKKILPICGAVFLILLALAFSLKVSSQFSRVWAFTWFGSIVVLISLQRVCVYRLLKRWTARGYLTRNIVIVGAGEQADRLLQRLDQGQEPWNRIKGIFDDRADRIDNSLEKYSNLGEVKILGTVEHLLEYARCNRIDDVIVTLPWHADRRLQFIIEKLRELPLHIHLGCDLVGYMFPRPTFSAIANVPLLHIAHKPVTGWKYVAKAVEDRVLGVILLILLTPLALLIALAIKLESPGPILFRQQRHGFNNKVFTVFKFRTMHHDRPPEVGAPQAKQNDPRVTRIGNLLRRTSLDELPQIINVVQGTMSLVGPRPHPLSLDYEFAPKIDGYFARHRLKPGITGWAQINGYRGETETAEKMRKRVEYDLHYIENWSLLFDLQILLMTPFAGVSHFHNKQSF